jgi:hypothetical protein
MLVMEIADLHLFAASFLWSFDFVAASSSTAIGTFLVNAYVAATKLHST